MNLSPSEELAGAAGDLAGAAGDEEESFNPDFARS
jgi:hypothetical protein